jgi:hypothetical protein
MSTNNTVGESKRFGSYHSKPHRTGEDFVTLRLEPSGIATKAIAFRMNMFGYPRRVAQKLLRRLRL